MIMKKIILATATLLFISIAGIGTYAQDGQKKEEKKTESTTIDAWREALPGQEQPAYVPPPKADDGLGNDTDVVETPAEIEARILSLETRLMEAVKGRDSKTLTALIANDFVVAGINMPGAQTDKARFIDWTKKKFTLKSYTLGQPTVHTYTTSAVVTYNYKRQAAVGDAASDGDFTVTNVWIKKDNLWQLVSHHISSLPKS